MKLHQNKAKWVKQFKSATLKGAPLHNNAAVEHRYASKLSKLIEKMTRETMREIEALYKTPHAKNYFTDASPASQARILMSALQIKFENMFGRDAGIIAGGVINDIDKASVSALNASLEGIAGAKFTVNTKIISANLKETMKASIAVNAQLIKSIPNEYINKVSGAVYRSITSGQGMADLRPQIQAIGGMTERKAKNAALDQTHKAYNAINADRLQKAGVKKFEWVHSGGGRHPREDHIAMDGQIYSYDNLPVIDKNTGERGLPGQAVNCKCTQAPVFSFLDED